MSASSRGQQPLTQPGLGGRREAGGRRRFLLAGPPSARATPLQRDDAARGLAWLPRLRRAGRGGRAVVERPRAPVRLPLPASPVSARGPPGPPAGNSRRMGKGGRERGGRGGERAPPWAPAAPSAAGGRAGGRTGGRV